MLGFGQSAFTIVAKVAQDREEELRAKLTTLGQDAAGNTVLGFGEVPNLHFCTLVLFTVQKVTWLTFEGNIDGEVKSFFQSLIQAKAGGIDFVFGCCVDYDPTDRLGYLLSHDRGVNTFYVGAPGRTLGQIRLEDTLRTAIEDFVDAEQAAGRVVSRQSIVSFVGTRADISGALSPYERPLFVRIQPTVQRVLGGIGWFLKKCGLVLGILILILLGVLKAWVALAVIVVVAALLGAFRARFLQLEKADVPYANRFYLPLVVTVLDGEDFGINNHMAAADPIKPGFIRLTVLRFVLWAINLAAVFIANKGQLGGIPSIHFARWLIINNDTLLFYSNFGGSWESYLNDFIVKAHTGLTAVWSNCTGFPRAKKLTGGGATNESEFKVYARNSQVPTLFWYQAYPDLSTSNIENNTRIREGLLGSMTKAEEERWLSRI